MKKTRIKQLLLLLTAMIWGFAFVAQDKGMDFIEPFTFNTARSFIAVVVLIPCIYLIKKIQKPAQIKSLHNTKKLIEGGIVTGVFLFFGMNLQQFGILGAGAGMSGFITTLYILFVPLIGLFFGRKIDKFLILCIFIALTGLYLVNYSPESIEISVYSILLLGCAIAYAFQISAIDYYTKRCDSFKLTLLQFLVGGVLSMIGMFVFEQPTLPSLWDAIVPLLYVGVMSSGVAFTIQTVAQKDVNPVIAALIMSFEAIFALIGGYLVLHERFTLLEFIGCMLIFGSVIVSQIPRKNNKYLEEEPFIHSTN